MGAVQTQSELDNPAKPLDADLNRRSNRSAVGFRFQEPTPVGRVAGLLLQNPSNLNSTEAI